MKFNEIPYKRPDIGQFEKNFIKLLNDFDKAQSFEIHDRIMRELNALRNEYLTQNTIAYIKYSADTLNEFNRQEKDFFDRNDPVYEELQTKYYKSVINSKYKKELEQKWGRRLFSTAEQIVKTYQPEIKEDLRIENKLKTEYSKLLGSAKIMFEGKERNLSGLVPFIESEDRAIRKAASEAKWNFFNENRKELDRLFNELVKIRTEMARKIGYKNFIEMGYARMERTDYNADMVKIFRAQVEKYIVPISLDLRQKQKERLGLDSMKYYDQPIEYKSGNAKPQGDPEWILNCAKKMYEELSPQTGEFFNFMLENQMMDLVTRKGKDIGGYCTFLANYKSPFIFSNFNGTKHDVIVLTHEAGHAFQAYSSRHLELPEYLSPTSEACEIHSMSMEFLTWPWMNSFFKEQTDKFKYSHLKESLSFIPYGVSVDEFQHFVYENPDLSPMERKKAWRSIEKKYIPDIDYDGNQFLEEGGRWQFQRHIYLDPFYYIDYCLAQICAFQFWKKSTEENGQAIKDYIKLCHAGGSKTFLELVSLANLQSPFDENCIESFVDHVKVWLNSIDDKALN